jgi:hypothetical protein
LSRVTWPRVGFMVALLALGFLLTRGTGRTTPHVSKERAVTIARPYVKFTPDGHTIRFVRRGIPPRAFWAVSFWVRRKTGGGYARITFVLLSADSGRVSEVRRSG